MTLSLLGSKMGHCAQTAIYRFHHNYIDHYDYQHTIIIRLSDRKEGDNSMGIIIVYICISFNFIIFINVIVGSMKYSFKWGTIIIIIIIIILIIVIIIIVTVIKEQNQLWSYH
jgi:hypothetical protein